MVSFKLAVSALSTTSIFDEAVYFSPSITVAERAQLLTVVGALRNDAGCFAGVSPSTGVLLVAIRDFASDRDDDRFHEEDPVNGPLAPTICPSAGSPRRASDVVGDSPVASVQARPTSETALAGVPLASSTVVANGAPRAAHHDRRVQTSAQFNASGVELELYIIVPPPAFNATLIDSGRVDAGDLYAEYLRQMRVQNASVGRLAASIADLVTPAHVVNSNPALVAAFRGFIREGAAAVNLDTTNLSLFIWEPPIVVSAPAPPREPPAPSRAPASSPAGPTLLVILAATFASLGVLLAGGVCTFFYMRRGRGGAPLKQQPSGAAAAGTLAGVSVAVASSAAIAAQVAAIGIGSAVTAGLQTAAAVDPVLGPLGSLLSIAQAVHRQLQAIEHNSRQAAAVRDRLAMLVPMLERAKCLPEFETQYATLIECTLNTFVESEAFMREFVKEAQPGFARWCIRFLRASIRSVELNWLSSSLGRHVQDLTAAVALLAAGAGSRDAAEHRAAIDRMARQHAEDLARLRSIMLQPRTRGDILATLVERSIVRHPADQSQASSVSLTASMATVGVTQAASSASVVSSGVNYVPLALTRGGLTATASTSTSNGDPAASPPSPPATSTNVSATLLMSGSPPVPAEVVPAERTPPASPLAVASARPRTPVSGAGAGTIAAALHVIELQQLDLRTSVSLGRGAYGRVRSAVWSNIEVAVKEIALDLDGSGEIPRHLVAEFHREIALHWSLRHPHIVSVYGSIEDVSYAPGPVYGIVMERMSRSLYSALRRPESSPLGLGDRVRICLEVATGLAYLHSKGVIHADLKSPNVLLDARNTAKLSDFGLSSLHDPAVSSLLTRSRGGPVGTPLWMAPELFSDPSQGGNPGRPTPSSDMFALGVTLWEALAGEVPYAHLRVPNLSVVLPALVCDGTRPSLELLPSELPSSVAALLRRLWDGDPRQRATAQEAVDALRNVAPSLSAPAAALALIVRS